MPSDHAPKDRPEPNGVVVAAMTPVFSPSWLNDLAALLRQRVDTAPGARISLDIAMLAAQWQWPVTLATDMICDAARLAGLAIGLVDAGTLDIMNVDIALTLMDCGMDLDGGDGTDLSH